MIKKHYCNQCGHPNNFLNGKTPNFCSECGNKTSASAVTKTPVQVEVIEDEDATPTERIPQIQGLEFEIKGRSHNSVSMKDLINDELAMPQYKSLKDLKRPKLSQSQLKKVGESIKNECQSSKNNPINIGGE